MEARESTKSPFETMMEHTEKLIAERTCPRCIDRNVCEKQKECIQFGGFHSHWRGETWTDAKGTIHTREVKMAKKNPVAADNVLHSCGECIKFQRRKKWCKYFNQHIKNCGFGCPRRPEWKKEAMSRQSVLLGNKLLVTFIPKLWLFGKDSDTNDDEYELLYDYNLWRRAMSCLNCNNMNCNPKKRRQQRLSKTPRFFVSPLFALRFFQCGRKWPVSCEDLFKETVVCH